MRAALAIAVTLGACQPRTVPVDPAPAPQPDAAPVGARLVAEATPWLAPLPCAADGAVLVRNEGDREAPITDLALAGEVFEIHHPLPPFRIAPGETVEIAVTAHAEQAGAYDGVLRILSAGGSPIDVSLSAVAGWTDVHSEAIVPGGPRPIDVWLLLDASPALQEAGALDALKQALPLVMDVLEDQGVPWQIALLPHDDGCATGVIDRDTPDPVALVEAAMTAGTVAPASLTERALAAHDQLGPGGCNEGLYTPGDLLQVTSVGGVDESDLDVHAWIEAMGVAVPREDLIFSAVTWRAGTCGVVDEGLGDLAAATVGEVLDLCDDGWVDAASLLVPDLAALARIYHLTAQPEPDTLMLFVDDMVQLAGWHYDAAANVVQVDQNRGVIDVSYGVAATCP